MGPCSFNLNLVNVALYSQLNINMNRIEVTWPYTTNLIEKESGLTSFVKRNNFRLLRVLKSFVVPLGNRFIVGLFFKIESNVCSIRCT
jgi:hypothetical protein